MITILMATYNGEKYIEEQLDSILCQSYCDYKLVVHDDGSNDKTVEIVKKYISLYPDKINLVEDGIKTGGPRNNFFHLMRLVDSPYIMFCDQDDIWLKDKIKNAINACMKMESKVGENIPVLIFSDLIVTDEKLNVISNSLFKMQKTESSMAENINQLVYKNCITGCTMLFNKKALKVSLPTSCNAIMHDWWVALNVLKNKGAVLFIDSKDIYYRQHGMNSVGAKKFSWFKLFKKDVFKNIKEKHMQANSVGYKLSFTQFFILSIYNTIKFGFK